jgi:hypothetical protein
MLVLENLIRRKFFKKIDGTTILIDNLQYKNTKG